MDSDDELEPFQITEEDQANEFRPRRRRFRKEDAIYGMWAEQDSDDENRKDYTRGINFVSTNKQEDDDNDKDESDPDEEEIDTQINFILNSREEKKLEQGGEKIKIGNFETASLKRNKELHMFPTHKAKSTNNGVRKKKRSAGTIVEKRKRELMVSDRDWGKWEKHTTGFGSRILQKMGYVAGMGLGQKGEGIVNPVKASKLKELGQTSHTSYGGGVHVVEDSEEEEEEEAFQQQREQWRLPGDKGQIERPNYTFKTVDELRQTSKKQPYKGGAKGIPTPFVGGETKVKVIDMTGKETRVLSSYDDLRDKLSQSTSVASSDQVFLPELMHNLELLVDQTEHSILQSDRKLQYNQDLIVNLTHEKNRLQQTMIEEKEQILKLTEIVAVVDIFESRLTDKTMSSLTLTECEDMLSQIQNKFPVEYKLYELSSLAVAVVFPIFKSVLQGWDIVGDPSGPIPIFQQWKVLLRERSSSQTIPDPDKMDPYDRLIWEVWMPKIRQMLSNWSPKTQVETAVDLLLVWMPLLSDWILNNILDSIILPQLQQEVDRWDPTSDPMPIHLWIHPWQPLMETQLEVLYPTIRRKLGFALNNLQPLDYSPHVILKPWAKVFSPGVMEAFLARTVLPKLIYCLQTLVINPQNEHIAPVKWILSWKDLIPVHHFVDMFDKFFFPRWLQILATWLSGNPNYDEVTKWYAGWKNLFDKDMLADPVLKSNFNRALTLMDHAAHGTFIPGMRENMAYFTTSERRRTAEIQRPTQVSPVVSVQNTAVSFKDVVEKKAEELGMLFIPSHKRYEGKTLYNFGTATIYIDRGVIFIMNDNKWTPVSLDGLADLLHE